MKNNNTGSKLPKLVDNFNQPRVEKPLLLKIANMEQSKSPKRAGPLFDILTP
jgi:hypothetical protein